MNHSANFSCQIWSNISCLFQGSVFWVQLPTLHGTCTIFPDYAPFVQKLDAGIVYLKQSDQELRYEIEGGLFTIWNNASYLLTQSAKPLSLKQ